MATPQMDTGMPRDEPKKMRGTVVQRLGMIQLKDWKRNGWGFIDLVMTLRPTPKTGKLQRHIYINVRRRLDAVPKDILRAKISAINLSTFVDNYFRFGPMTGDLLTKVRVFHPEVWEKHGNHKLRFKRPIVKLFEKQKRKAEDAGNGKEKVSSEAEQGELPGISG